MIAIPIKTNVSKNTSIIKDEKHNELNKFKLFVSKNKDIVKSAINNIMLTWPLDNSVSPRSYAGEGFLNCFVK